MREKRKYPRYDTEAKIYFRVNYDLKTKVKFQVFQDGEKKHLSRKYAALSRDISAEGLGFCSNRALKKSDLLYLEVYLPRRKTPLHMTGEVRWSRPAFCARKHTYKFDTGIKLLTVLGEPVARTIHRDKKHKVIWSKVLESVFGNFRKIAKKL